MMQEKFLPTTGEGEGEAQGSTLWDWQLQDKTVLADLPHRFVTIQTRAWALSHHEVTEAPPSRYHLLGQNRKRNSSNRELLPGMRLSSVRRVRYFNWSF